MRVIAGKARRLNLKTIPGNETRPTTDRIKETLFNILQPEIPGCRFLDLFSGSGAIGIEALSRGAEYAVFVEKNPKACTCIRENLSFTKLTDGGKLLNMDVLQALRSLEGGEPFDCIFMDAPYEQHLEQPVLEYLADMSKQELQARQEQLAKEEKERAALDGITTDKVICGEQQPESDHFIRMENSRTGDDEGVHWRETTGWFSYRMKTNGKPVHKVRILFRPEIRKDAKVWINGQEVGKLADKPASDLSVGIVDVPVSMQSDDQLEIKIGRGNEKVTPHIYEVRLVTE